MSESVKFTEDELKEVKSLQTNYLDIQNQYGQLSLAKIRLKRQENQLSEKLKEIENIEKSFLDKVTEKYGKGSLNPETGGFTPEKS